MRGPAWLLPLLVLCLGQIKVLAACNECSSVMITADSTDINIKKPLNFTINNITFTNGTFVKAGPLNELVSGLEPGVQYTVHLENITEFCCKNITTKPTAVADIQFSDITTTAVTVTWKSNDRNAPNYIYKIVIDGNGSSQPEDLPGTTKKIRDLQPGTLYTFTIYPRVADAEGDSNMGFTYTKPSAVMAIHIENINSTAVNLSWNNPDPNSANYTYRIQFGKEGTENNVTSDDTWISIGDLEPGTLYIFSIFPRINETEGDPMSASIYTEPSAVMAIHIENINSTAVNLSWNNPDPNSANYTYRIQFGKEGTENNVTTSDTRISIGDLEPGTLYIFSIFPRINETEGDPTSTSIYTEPSAVMAIHIENINSTAVNLSWNNNDPNSANYTYRIQFGKEGTENNVTTSDTRISIGDLEPGTLYIFSIFPRINETEGDPKSASIYTKPSAVMAIHIENINSTAVNLSWNNPDPNSANYTYRIQFGKEGTENNVTTSDTRISIGDLEPGTLYIFSIFPQINETEGDAESASIYTEPSAVMAIHIENINSTAVNLSWNNNDPNSANYTYRIQFGKEGTENNVTTSDTRISIGDLEPGTLYIFSIFPRINETEGDAESASIYTEPSAVIAIHIENINSTAVNLRWNNPDPNSANYTYRIQFGKEGTENNVTTSDTRISIGDLEPGTLYIFSIFPRINATEGDPKNASIYTKPSAVSNITVNNINTTRVILSWSIEDEAASGYTYRIVITSVASPNIIQSSSSKTASIQGLRPGTSYNFSVVAQVNSGKTEGDSSSLSVCTVAAPVVYLNCTPVPKQPELNLSWNPPDGNYNSFKIQISNGTSIRVENSSRDPGATIKDLRYFANYTVRIVTISCGEMSLPQEKICLTSITDPPVPSEKPDVKATSHSSLKVQFSPFDAIYGPLRAYAVIITSSKEMKCTNESLSHTYQDFTKKKTDSYVAYVKDVQDSPEVDHYDIEIGSGSKNHDYFNGKLDPLGSYRACVAGFTHIVFNENNSISLRESYVSFSDFSQPVVLPQNPDVITGAVVGCVLAAILIAAIAVFMFWRKRRKHGKNNDVPFSAIAPKKYVNSIHPKSKLIKVENFESYFKKQKADSNCGFAEEYEDLRPVGVNQPKFAAELPENKGKNRYNNVLPYDISRVKLSVQSHQTDDYINANYMPGYNSKKEFIAAQGPLPNTVQDFWRMIWEKNIHTIVMLTKCIEQGRTKCEEYWPNKQSKNYGDLTVAMTSEIILPEWTIRDFSMEKSDPSVSHHVRQFHFTAWPDHRVPDTTDLLISFRHLVRDYMKQNPPTPTLVHCSAGVGRTGTFISIDRLIHQMEIENTVDVYGCVYDLRMHRPLMVQTEEQYIFLNQCVMDIIKSNKEKKADLIYQNTNAMAIYENFRPSPHLGKANGYHM